jgi:Wiskott-Aldrich syndrome protein
LKDKAKREFIYDFFEQHGGKEAAIREISSMQQNAGLFSASPVPVRNPPSTPQAARMAPPLRPTTTPSPTHFLKNSSSLSFVPLLSPQLDASSKMTPVTIASISSPASLPPPPQFPSFPPMLDEPSPPVYSFTLFVSSLAQPVGDDVMNGTKEVTKLTLVLVDHSIKMNLKSLFRPESTSVLLVEIRAAITLTPMEKDIDHEPVTDDIVEVITGALARVLEERCRLIHSDSE